MKSLLQLVYVIYQYLIALPIFVCITIFTAITTIVFMHWRNSAWLHSIQQFWSKSFFRLLFVKVNISGLENINSKTSYVFVSNHQSMADVFAIYGWLPNVFKWIMKKELRKIPFVGTACAAAGHIYIDRSNKKASFLTMKKAEKILTNGVSVVIFPEGTRTHNGEVGRFKRGAFAIANDINLPIVPITLDGFYELMPRGRFYATRKTLIMKIDKPISFSNLTEEEKVKAIEKTRQTIINNIQK